MYIKIPNTIDRSHIGKIVLFLYPTPKSRRLPSVLYKNAGLYICIVANRMTKIIIDTRGKFSLSSCFILYILTKYYFILHLLYRSKIQKVDSRFGNLAFQLFSPTHIISQVGFTKVMKRNL